MVWEGRVYGLIDSLKSIFKCSSLEEKVDATWIIFSTLGTSSPHQSAKEVAEISEMLKTILFLSAFIAVTKCLFIGQVGFVFPVRGWNTHRIALQYFCWLGENYLSVLRWRSVMWLWIFWYHTNVINCYGREGCWSWQWRSFSIPISSPQHFLSKIGIHHR